MRNLDPVLIERANQVSFSGGGGNLVNREYLNAVSRFSSRFPETDDLEENQHLFLRARLEGWQELVYTAYSDRLRRRAEFVSWMVAGRSNYNFKKAQKQLDAERRAEESFAAKMTAYLDHTANQLARLVSPARQIEAYANGCDDPIASGDPLALEKLQARLDYLTAAQELRHGNANLTAAAKNTGEMVKALSAPMLFDYMAIVMDKQALADEDFTVNVTLPDVGERHMLRVKNGVLLVYKNTLSDSADVSVTCPKNALFAILTNNQETVAKAVQIEGRAELLTRMMENMNQFRITGTNPVNIIEP